MQEILIGAVQDILVTIVLAVLSLGGAYALYYIDVARRNLQARTQLEIVNNMIARAAALAESVVMSLESTVAKDLRELVKSGQASRDELVAIGDRAVQTVLERLGVEGRAALEETVGDVEAFVRDLVEAKVEELKRGIVPAGVEATAKNSVGSVGS